MSQVDIDVAVVGAGPAGSAAALALARQGRSVALIERGEVPGSKNLSGGVLYLDCLRGVVDDVADLPIERKVTRHVTTLLQPDSSVSLDYADRVLAEPDRGLPNAATVLRARLDPWLAAQAEATGAFLMPGMRVDALATETARDGRSRVCGVVADGQVMRAHAVVLADGVNSFLAREAGLRSTPPNRHLGLGVKAVVHLDPQRIEDRFGVRPGEGSAHAIVGDATLGVAGGAFLYTNAESLSVGIVVRLDDLLASGRTAREVFDHLLGHPGLARYLDGGEVIEFGSHLVAEGGLAGVGEIAHDGAVLVGDAAGLTINSGLVLRGMDLAITSGLTAGDAIADALAHDDTSKESLQRYPNALARTAVMQDVATYRGMPDLLERRGPYRAWGEVASTILRDTFGLDGRPRERLGKTAWSALRRSGVGLRTWLGDLRSLGRSI